MLILISILAIGAIIWIGKNKKISFVLRGGLMTGFSLVLVCSLATFIGMYKAMEDLSDWRDGREQTYHETGLYLQQKADELSQDSGNAQIVNLVLEELDKYTSEQERLGRLEKREKTYKFWMYGGLIPEHKETGADAEVL